MKRIIFITCISLVSLVASAQWESSYNKTFGLKNDLLPANLILEYEVKAHDTSYLDNYSIYNPEIDVSFFRYTKRIDQPGKTIDALILENVFSEKIKLYSLVGTSTYPYAIKGESVRYADLFYKLANYDKSKQNISRNFDKYMFDSFKFREEWLFNEKDFVFKKKVLSYSPIIKNFFRNNKELPKPTFDEFATIITDSLPKTNEADFKLITHVEYDLFIRNEFNDFDAGRSRNYFFYLSPYWNNIPKRLFLESLVDKVERNKTTAYDYTTKKPLSQEEFKKRMRIREDTITVEIVLTGIKTKKPIHMVGGINQIAALNFIEDWYLNPNTLELRKKVIGIAPVMYNYNAEDNERKKPIRYVPFMVYFNKTD